VLPPWPGTQEKGDEEIETKTPDMQLAAYLLTSGYPLLRVEGDTKRRVFVFDQCPEEVRLPYYQGRDTVSARKLFSAYRDLKSLVFQAQ
jgi:hypothetical protein